MENYNFTQLEEEMFALLNSLKKESGDKEVVFAAAVMCMDNEEAQRNVINYIKDNRESVSLDDVCRFIGSVSQPLDVTDIEDDDSEESA